MHGFDPRHLSFDFQSTSILRDVKFLTRFSSLKLLPRWKQDFLQTFLQWEGVESLEFLRMAGIRIYIVHVKSQNFNFESIRCNLDYFAKF